MEGLWTHIIFTVFGTCSGSGVFFKEKRRRLADEPDPAFAEGKYASSIIVSLCETIRGSSSIWWLYRMFVYILIRKYKRKDSEPAFAHKMLCGNIITAMRKLWYSASLRPRGSESDATDEKKSTKPFGLVLFFLAGAEGLEPTTHGFGDQYSTNWAIPLRTKILYHTIGEMSSLFADFLLFCLNFLEIWGEGAENTQMRSC